MALIYLQWWITRVVFIPRPGRIDYNQAGAYRPISLTSSLLKTMERLIDRHVRDGPLRPRPLYALEFAYQATNPQKQHCTSLYMDWRTQRPEKKGLPGSGSSSSFDIERAFNCTTVESICRAAGRHGLEHTVTRWIRNVLSTRLLTVSRAGNL